MLKKKEAQRHALLKAIYEMADGEPGEHAYSELYECSSNIGMSQEETDSAFQWLVDKDMLARYAVGYFQLTRDGVDEMEASLREPDQPTEHFAPSVTMNFYGGAVGAIQTGSHNTANVAQQFNAGNQLADVMSLIEKLRQGVAELPESRREEAIEVVDALEQEAKSSAPKKALIKSYASTLNTYLLAYAPVITQIVDMIHSRTR